MQEEELLKKLREAFNGEAKERLANMSSCLVELEKESELDKQKPILEVIFREAHSLKGSARVVNLPDIETIFQSIESIFSAIKKEEIELSSEMFDILHSATAIMENFLTASNADQSIQNKENIASLIHQLEDLKRGSGRRAEDRGQRTEDRGTDRRQRTPVKLASPTDFTGQAEDPGEISVSDGFHGPDGRRETMSEDVPREAKLIQSRPLISETVRIAISKLEAVLLKAEELISLKLSSSQHLSNLQKTARSFEHWKKRWAGIDSELRILRKQVSKEDHSKKRGQNSSTVANLLAAVDWNQDYIRTLKQEISRLTKAAMQNHRTLGSMVDDLLDDMKRTTLLPFDTLFVMLPRMVRDISRDRGKETDLVLAGGEIGIDKRILEHIKDPIIHLLRNAVDHGLEDPETRLKRQKPSRGTITMSVSQPESNKVEILIADDGRGIDLSQVKQKAVKTGVISNREAEHLTDHEALSLIYQSGVSTSAIITEISGRGLGMAIVQENVEKLGGILSVENNPGKGASFRIQLPTTLSIYRGVLIRVANFRFIMPNTQVESISRIRKDEVKTVEGRATISLNGEVLPLVDLSDVLGFVREDFEDQKRQKNDDAFVTAMILGSGEKRIAFTIDEVLGEQEVLLKNLGKQLCRVPNIAGATILGTGEVVPILNGHDLLKSPVEATVPAPGVAVIKAEGEAERGSILIAEDSITSRMLLKNILESAGYLVKTAVDGQDAFTALKTEVFDLVVSDIEMPRMDGFELTAKIRSDTKLAETPVVLVTGLDSRTDREKGIDVGANAYIVKRSFDQSNLLDTVRRLI